MKKIFFFSILSAITLSTQAQVQQSGWLASFNTINTGKKTSIHADVQLRSSDKFEHVQSLLLRSGLNYRFNKKMQATAGYAYIHNRRVIGNTSGYAHEHRSWQQFIYMHKIKTLAMQHRVRLEQRFISKSAAVNNTLRHDGYAHANRLRYFTRGILPLQKQKTFSKGLFVAAQNEFFVNLGDNDAVNNKVFDQNRLYFALGHRLSPKADIEAGYMNQYINGRGDQFTNNHIIQIATYLRL